MAGTDDKMMTVPGPCYKEGYITWVGKNHALEAAVTGAMIGTHGRQGLPSATLRSSAEKEVS